LSCSLLNRLNTLLLYVLPHHLLSRGMHWLARIRWAPLKNSFIRLFIRRFRIDMSLAQETRPEAYPDFNSFFTRALRQEVRPIVDGTDEIACPVDGVISQSGAIQEGRMLQAKGCGYRLDELLGRQHKMTALFSHGLFATIYLSPRDYHRIHMPLQGTLQQMCYIPGRLYSVNSCSTQKIPGLFTRNERLVTLFDTAAGPMVMVLVGAIFVSSMETVWQKTLRGDADGGIRHWDYRQKPPITLDKGAEMGRFNMGSTVIVLFDAHRVSLAPEQSAGQVVQMGQLLAQRHG